MTRRAWTRDTRSWEEGPLAWAWQCATRRGSRPDSTEGPQREWSSLKIECVLLKKELVLSIHQISEGHGSRKIKKHCVIGRVWEVLDSVRKREVLSFKSEKVTFQKAQSLSQKTTKQTTTNKHENRYSINLLRWSYFLNHWQTPELAGKQKPERFSSCC